MQNLHAMTGGPWGDSFKPQPLADIGSLVFAPDGRSILAACGDDILSINLINGAVVQTLVGHTARVRAIAYSPDGQLVASGGDDATIRLWNAVTGKNHGSVLRGHQGAVLAVAFASDGHSVISAGGDGTIRVWKLEPVTLPDDRHENLLVTPQNTQDGWLHDPSSPDQRLLWVPPKYRDNIDVAGRSKVIAAHWHYATLAITGDMFYGERWADCWNEESEPRA